MVPENSGFMDMWGEIPLFFKLFGSTVVLLVLGTFLYVIVKGLTTWSSNNASQLEARSSRAVAKRTEVWGGSGDSSSSTNYYITFEFENGERKELYVRPNQYGLIVVGDTGTLTYQGTRFKGFERSL